MTSTVQLEPAAQKQPMTDPVQFLEHPDGLEGYQSRIQTLCESYELKRLCDVGGGANPSLPLQYVQGHEMEYTLLDISPEELAKAPEGYQRQVADICDDHPELHGRFDMIFSRMVAEHVADGQKFHTNIHKMLAPGGVAFHRFPTLYSPVFLINRLIPEFLSSGLLDLFRPRDRFQRGKFPAYYSWCRGPSPGQLQRLEGLGYRVLEYRGYFGHRYFKRIPIASQLHRMLARHLIRHPAPLLTTYADLVVQKIA